MFLSGIKYQLEHDTNTYTYRFHNAESRFRNVVIHFDGQDPEHLKSALLYALTGRVISPITAVLLFLVDSNGDQWQLERRGDRSRFSKNRQAMESDGEQQFREALLDGPDSESVLFDIYKISYQEGGLTAQRDGKESQVARVFHERGQKKLDDLIGACAGFLTSSHKVSLPNLVSFARKSRSLLTEWSESSRHLNLLMEKYGALQEIDSTVVETLEQELNLLRRLEKDAEFLNDPSRSFDVMKQKLRRTHKQLSSICEKNQILQLPTLDQEIDWGKVISSLARLQAYEKLEQGYRNSFSHVENMVKPLFQEHIRSMRGFLSEDKRLLGEIEQSLQSLTNHCQTIQQEQQSKNQDKSMLKKLFGERENAHAIPSPRPDILDSSRSAVDQVLRALGSMCSNLEVMTTSYTEGLDSIQERYEKVVKERGKAKDEWLVIAKRYQFDPAMNLKSMLNLISNLGQISSLYSQKKDFKIELTSYRNKLKKLEKIVLDWRALTGSQKSGDLDQVSILISEVRSLVQYKGKKEDQLIKARKLITKVDFFQSLRRNYETSIKQCESQWRKNFSLLDLPYTEIGAKNWNRFFSMVDQCEAFAEILDDDTQTLQNEEVFSLRALSSPLNIFALEPMAKEGQLEFIRQIETLSPHCNLLIILYDRDLAEMLIKLGVGYSKAIRSKNIPTNEESSEKNKSSHDPVMSEKARAALELFKGRNGALSHE
ncbi:hypothetical protein SAMN06296036_102319 [Pseudobacteriovorax antillogorgiicola]|uniref:Uncharacterized protein n=1 Tax=Pseudobacteriovorax antillogorgiicola TaxID=1513793 RepID=A0A1Y6B7C1_9BACT|nr:hypothetical protein EDD56_102124 [Pseudobacteriovorax antillogorgiicola]SME96859.1 hypothetical protein SAMN06296036_102319 [Pseudobacteriovorax antillogorgiicola]